jgi:hypothetical protein
MIRTRRIRRSPNRLKFGWFKRKVKPWLQIERETHRLGTCIVFEPGYITRGRR